MARVRLCVVVALWLVVCSSAFAAPLAFPPGQDQVLSWEQSSDAVTLIGSAYLGTRFVRLSNGGSVAAYITEASLADAVYGMTAGIARFSPTSQWTLEVFAGGAPTLGSSVPAGSTLLISASGAIPIDSSEDLPVWLARGTGHSNAVVAPPAGTPVWGRIRVNGGGLGVDSVLGVENVSAIWYPGDPASRGPVTNWDFENVQLQAELPEPSTFLMFASGIAVVAMSRFRRRS